MLLAAELIHVMKCSPYIRGNYRLDRMALPVSVGVYVFSFIYVFVGNGTGKRLYVMKSKIFVGGKTGVELDYSVCYLQSKKRPFISGVELGDSTFQAQVNERVSGVCVAASAADQPDSYVKRSSGTAEQLKNNVWGS